ncbi:hypothetical protein J2793_003027 [Paraburkholderia caledonica]|uniref:Uncharacterized protein n=1 Tax=Paraburkholderia caledonica TaxID=134536 RepID=A0AB73IC23_9BURK|nr:hypothetical protein [Paraburkholderia caledonica]
MPFQRMPDALFSRALAECDAMVKPRDVLIDCQDLPFALRCLRVSRAWLLTVRGHRNVWGRISRATPASNVTAQFTGQ